LNETSGFETNNGFVQPTGSQAGNKKGECAFGAFPF
jgi:hypothetical protein